MKMDFASSLEGSGLPHIPNHLIHIHKPKPRPIVQTSQLALATCIFLGAIDIFKGKPRCDFDIYTGPMPDVKTCKSKSGT